MRNCQAPGLAVLVYKSARRKDIAPRDDDDEDTED
jgi:hypothetical protein